jgi:DNA repair exonuclease SbcCD nuclease subunit
MSAILTADTHWNDNPRDELRWGLLTWLAEQQADELIILGDLTQAKNNHPARMVNRLIDAFMTLTTVYKKIYILKGNHDYIDPNCPFFGFLNHFSENIIFILMPMILDLTIGQRVFMPAGTDWIDNVGLIEGKSVFAHVTFDGAVSESGFQLTGVDPNIVLEAGATVISGDIHKRQVVAGGAIEYVGAPYHINFGDDYIPRILLINDDGSRVNLHYPSPAKHTQIIKSLDELYRIKIKPGDQIKIIAQLRRADLPEWKSWRDAIKEQAETEGWQLFGPELRLQSDTAPDKASVTTHLSNNELVRDYALRQSVGEDYITVGQELLNSTR